MSRHRLIDQMRQPHPSLNRCIVDKLELGHSPQAEALGKQAAKEPRGVLKRPNTLLVRSRVIERTDVDLREAEIPAHVDLRHRDQAYPRILEFQANHLRQVALDLVRDT